MRAPGERWIDHRGYVRVACPGGWQYEHRLVMERVLRRDLGRGEAVHHLNDDKADNRPENLALMSVSEHIAHHNRLSPKRRKRTPQPARLPGDATGVR